ncbi:MAG: mannose-1-phosphate guanylyltransferase/mannose-6-phosphate isomerase [Alphaproteobacteria bacterium]|nr:mannose-1-phosphate guanylyltransferase/mannose-6-phosphate isomerase [Alphaproteobacteria bacterium]
MKIVPVVMSGGAGTRLWPLSRSANPKQLHALVTDLTLIQHSIARVATDTAGAEFCEPVVVLNQDQLDVARSQVEQLDLAVARWVVEPVGRNTAPVAALAAEIVSDLYGEDALILLMPADHHIEDEPGFLATVRRGMRLARDGRIVTFGIRPNAPATGFGYILRGGVVGDGYEVGAFKEKPDEATARAYLDDGRYYWNAGIFLFSVSSVRAEMMQHCASLYEASARAVSAARSDGDVLALDAAEFERAEAISFDYAVMERTDNAAVVPADFGWSDVGSWSSLWDVCAKDGNGNVVRGDVHLEQTANSLVFSTGQRVGVVGGDGLVVIVTDDAVLVAHRDHDQSVKNIVQRLKDDGRLDLL